MTQKDMLLACFSGKRQSMPVYLPDLTLWYSFHKKYHSLPEAWQEATLPQIAAELGVPLWLSAPAWRIETPGVAVTTTEQGDERTIRVETSAGTLTAQWVRGPDGDWWQSEYPVKTEADLPAALAWAQSRQYIIDPEPLERRQAACGEAGLVALELPRRPYSDLLHEMLGWSMGLMLLGEPLVAEILDVLEVKLQAFLPQLAQLPAEIALSPDNLDGQFVSPKAFETYWTDSYRRTADTLHAHGKKLMVHIGGPVKRLLPMLADAGVDALEGIAGPPQSDTTLPEARQLVGDSMVLWGGISQDELLDLHDWPRFEEAVRAAARQARDDGRAVIGIADRVSAETELDRLRAVSGLIAGALAG